MSFLKSLLAKFLGKFEGVKTYACSLILLASSLVFFLGGISREQEVTVWSIFGPLALIALRSSHGKVATSLDAVLEKIDPTQEKQ